MCSNTWFTANREKVCAVCVCFVIQVRALGVYSNSTGQPVRTRPLTWKQPTQPSMHLNNTVNIFLSLAG